MKLIRDLENKTRWLVGLALLAAATCANAATVIAPNDPPDLGSAPPDLTQSVDPNIVVTFDDSGSMASNFMGDNRPFDGGGWNNGTPATHPWVCAGVIDPRDTTGSILSKAMNGVYYNPNVIYTPPLLQDGSSFPAADPNLAAVWADGFAINRPRGAVGAATASYINNPLASGGSDNRVAVVNGQLVNGTSTQSFTTACVTGSAPAACPANADAGSCVQVSSCSGGKHKFNYTVTTPTVTDKRWVCGTTTGSPTTGINPQYPTSFAGGEDVTLGGPYYYRLQTGVTIPVDTYGNPTAAGRTALYTPSNWEAVAITNTNVTIGSQTINQWQNFANWYAYYRTRNLMTRTALSRTFGVLGGNIRVAWQNINAGSYLLPSSAIITGLADTGSCNASSVNPVTEQSNAGTSCYRTAFFNWIYSTPASGGTPDRAATIRAGKFFERNSTDLKDPYYDIGVNADLGCRQNFHMLVTDGYWNEGDPALPGGFFTSEAGPPGGKFPDGTAYSTTDEQSRIFWDVQGATYQSSLANIAFFYWARDLRSDLAPTIPASNYHSTVPTYVKDNTVGKTTATGASAAQQAEEIYFNPANDPANWRHVVQFMVTLGVAGNLNFSNDVDCINTTSNDLCALRTGANNSTGSIGWPQPVNNSPPAIDDTWHAAINSRGSYFSASNPASLVSHLTDIINSIIARSGQSSAESVSTSILNQGAVGYQGGYNSSGWTGYLYKQKLDPKTGATVGSPVWDAGCYLTGGLCAATGVNVGAPVDPTARIIITSTGSPGSLTGSPFEWGNLGASEQAALSLDPTTTFPDTTTDLVPVANGTTDPNGQYRVTYLRGERTNESTPTSTAKPVTFRPRLSVLGSIINSQAVYEGAPNGGHLDVYPVGSPEQSAAASGNTYEKFVSTNLNRSASIYVGANDGMLHAFDAGTGAEKWAYVPNFLYANGQLDQLTNAANGLVNTVDDTPILQDVFVSGGWKTMLVGSMRLGGRGVYALDVTDGSAPLSESAAKGKFMWEFTSQQDADLGYTYGSVNIARLRCNTGSCDPGGTWVVLVAGGYTPKTIPGQTNGHSAINAAPGVTKTTSYLWVLNAADGSVIKKIPTTTGVISYGMSTPDMVDFGLDQVDDIAVAGDLAGNLWRFDLSDPDPTNWKVDNMFRTYTSSSACSTTNRHGVGCEPITVLPVAFPDPVTGSVIYVFGTGEYLGPTDRTSASVLTPQHFFGVRDYGTNSANYPIAEANLATQTATQDGAGIRSLTYTPAPPTAGGTAMGWQIPLNIAGIDGERDVTTIVPIFSTGSALLVSLIPGTNNDPCNPGRAGAIMAISAATGGPALPSTTGSSTGTVGSVVINPPAVGSASAVASLGGYNIIVPGMGANGDPTKPPQFPGLTPVWRRTSWNELLNNL